MWWLLFVDGRLNQLDTPGFYNGQQKLETTTRAYNVEFGQAKVDSIIGSGLYDTYNACTKYTEIMHVSPAKNG